MTDQANDEENQTSLDPDSLLEDKPYSTRQIAKMTGFTTETVRSWIHDGHLEAFKFGPRTWRVKRSVLIEFLNKRYGSGNATSL